MILEKTNYAVHRDFSNLLGFWEGDVMVEIIYLSHAKEGFEWGGGRTKYSTEGISPLSLFRKNLAVHVM